MPQPRVLIVDDDPHLKVALELWFAKRKYEIIFAADGEQGLHILRSQGPVDLVLTDFMMPELNGMELLRLLKSSTELFNTKVLVMSHNVNPEFKTRAIELGAVDYLSKADGAKLIVERVVQTLEGTPNKPPALPANETPVSSAEIRLMSESLLDLLQVVSKSDGIPPAAKMALDSAQKMADRIRASV